MKEQILNFITGCDFIVGLDVKKDLRALELLARDITLLEDKIIDMCLYLTPRKHKMLLEPNLILWIVDFQERYQSPTNDAKVGMALFLKHMKSIKNSIRYKGWAASNLEIEKLLKDFTEKQRKWPSSCCTSQLF